MHKYSSFSEKTSVKAGRLCRKNDYLLSDTHVSGKYVYLSEEFSRRYTI
jgi:hypothetical protein